MRHRQIALLGERPSPVRRAVRFSALLIGSVTVFVISVALAALITTWS